MLVSGDVNGAASLLIVDYGTGIRVAAPTTVLSSMTKAARQGILIKGGRYLEQLAKVDAIVFDKTGTLTLGTPEIVEVIAYAEQLSADSILGLAAAVQQRLTHPVAKKVADTLGITRYIAEALPEQKAELVRALQREGHTVAVVGDGINDSPALAQADVGIAMHGGADVARETAHVALLEGNLWKVPQAIDIARQSMHLIQQNWNLVFYPNTVAIALSLPGLIGPIGATLISNGSAILATLNALRPLLDQPVPRSTP